MQLFNTGNAYIYDWDGNNWVETKIIPSDGAGTDLFGWHSYLDGDRAVIASSGDDDNGSNSGSI